MSQSCPEVDPIGPSRHGAEAAVTLASTVAAAQLEQAFAQLPIALVVSLVNGLLLAVILWGAVDPWLLGGWLLTLILTVATRYALLIGFYRAAGPHREAGRWQRRFLAGACASGLAWGLAGALLFHPSSFPHQVFLAFVLGGMVAGAVPLLSVLDRAYACFAIPIIVPISFRMLAVDDREHWIMGLMILVFGAAMLASSGHMRRVFRDAVELRLQLSSSIESSRILEQLLRTDALTGIANRRWFDEALEEEWRRAKRNGGVLALITADIDHFKHYNDRYGHQVGDQCLIAVAQAMVRVLRRPGDLGARLGGEEFAFLLPNTPVAGAVAVAERLRRSVVALHLSHEASSSDEQVTVSLGVATTEGASYQSAKDLLRASDQALYKAKRQGRNRVMVALRRLP